MPDKKPDTPGESGVWRPFFRMLLRAKLPWIWAVITFALSVGGSALQLLFPDYTQRIIGGDFSHKTIYIFVGVMLLTLAVNIASSAIQGVASAKITRGMRQSVWNILTSLPMPRLEENGSKELISRATTDPASIGALFSSTLPGIVSTLYYTGGSLLKVGKYAVSMSVTMLVLVILQLILACVSGKIVYGYNNRVQTKLAKMTETVSEVMSNLPLVKIFTAERREEKRGRAVIADFNRATFIAQNVTNAFYYLTSFVNLMGTLTVIVYGGLLVHRGVIHIGAWVAYFMYYYYLAQNVMMVPYYWRELKGLQGTMRRLSAIACMESEDTLRGEAVLPAKNELSFEHVAFNYGDKQILQDVSFQVPAGSMVALVGTNGAGKSTIISLMERFYQPAAGTIRYGDKTSESISLDSWRKLFGYVQQDVRLMGGTIRDNLTYGMEREVTDAELDRVCASVGLDQFLAELPEKFNTPIEDFGDNLSGGQRQKIAIARAVLRNAEFLVLDEYESNLDIEAAEKAESCVEALRGSRTIFVIAHCLSTIENADKILVLSDGRIQAAGTHRELSESSSVYTELLHAQLSE